MKTIRPAMLALALMLLPACASAQSDSRPPRAIIQGPSAAIPGEMVVLDASTSEGAQTFKWQIHPELKGRKQLLEMDGGKRVQVASYGGRYVITLAVGNETGIDLLTWDLRIDGKAPCPPPEPSPGPGPDDVTPPGPSPVPTPEPKPVDPTPPKPEPVQPPPAGEFLIAPEVFDLASVATSATRVADCQLLASECDRIAGANWSTMNAIAAEIVAVLNKLPPGWEPMKTRVKDAIAGLYSNGRIKNAQDIARLLRELKVAFEKAGKVK